jgi:hypothetical protein
LIILELFLDIVIVDAVGILWQRRAHEYHNCVTMRLEVQAHDVASQFPGTRAWKLTGIHLLRDIMGWLGSLAQNWREN